eukprot:sb/3467992/
MNQRTIWIYYPSRAQHSFNDILTINRTKKLEHLPPKLSIFKFQFRIIRRQTLTKPWGTILFPFTQVRGTYSLGVTASHRSMSLVERRLSITNQPTNQPYNRGVTSLPSDFFECVAAWLKKYLIENGDLQQMQLWLKESIIHRFKSQVKCGVSRNRCVSRRCLSPIHSPKPLRTEPKLYQFIARSTRRLALDPEPRFEPGTFCMRSECVTTTPLSRRLQLWLKEMDVNLSTLFGSTMNNSATGLIFVKVEYDADPRSCLAEVCLIAQSSKTSRYSLK